jgi:hypothetical protein
VVAGEEVRVMENLVVRRPGVGCIAWLDVLREFTSCVRVSCTNIASAEMVQMQWFKRRLKCRGNAPRLGSGRETLVEDLRAETLMPAQCTRQDISLRPRILLLEIIRMCSSGCLRVSHGYV